MFEIMRQLHPRGAVNKGVCVDADGAMLGPDRPLVHRTCEGYRCVPRATARQIQRLLLTTVDDPDWLYEQGRRITDALNRGEVALAQIFGLRIPIDTLDGRQLKRLAGIAALIKTGYDPAEPRAPAGQHGGGRWIGADDGGDGDESGTAGPQAQPTAAGSGGGDGAAAGPQADPAEAGSDGGDGAASGPQAHPREAVSDDGAAGLHAHLIEVGFDAGDTAASGLQAHLIDAGYVLERDQWALLRELYRRFTGPGSTIASLWDYLAERGLNPDELPPVIKSLFDPPRPLAELQTSKPPRGFDTEAELRAYLHPPLPGYEWHHIVEQNGQFRPELISPEGVRTWIQHTHNMAMVPVIKHYCVNGLMSSNFEEGVSVRIRIVVKAHNVFFQQWVGQVFLRYCGVIP